MLIGTRLGIDGVNPVYYEAIKASFSRKGTLQPFVTNSLLSPSGDLHLASGSRNRRWPSLLLVLFCRISSGQPLLLGSASCSTRCSLAASSRRVRRWPQRDYRASEHEPPIITRSTKVRRSYPFPDFSAPLWSRQHKWEAIITIPILCLILRFFPFPRSLAI